MPDKPLATDPDDIVEILHFLLKHLDERFDAVEFQFHRMDQQFEQVSARLDRIEFLVSGQERRLSILEDRMRLVATKLGLEFRQEA